MEKNLNEPEGRKMLKEAFRVFDNTGEGVVTKKYLRLNILNCKDCSAREVDEMLEALDHDHDGNVVIEDFLRIFINQEIQDLRKTKSESTKCVIL